MTDHNIPSVVERPTDGEMYLWLVGNIEWLERTQELAYQARDRDEMAVAAHRCNVQLASLRRLKNLYEVLASDDNARGSDA